MEHRVVPSSDRSINSWIDRYMLGYSSRLVAVNHAHSPMNSGGEARRHALSTLSTRRIAYRARETKIYALDTALCYPRERARIVTSIRVVISKSCCHFLSFSLVYS